MTLRPRCGHGHVSVAFWCRGFENLPRRRQEDTRRSTADGTMHLIVGDEEDIYMEVGNGTLLERIRMEYIEMPDLRLTERQARRLWNLDAAVCETLLAALVGEGFLARTADGMFLRRRSDWLARPA